MKTGEALEALGVEVSLYDLWNPDLGSVDLVHYFSVQGGSINFCSYVKKKELPLVISPIIWLGKDKDAYPLDEIRELLNLADLVLPNSTAERKGLSDFFSIPAEKFFVTRNGVDPSFAHPVPGDLFRERFGLSAPFLLNVANIEPRKNQLNLIRAVKGMGMELVVLGNVRDHTYFEECMEEGKGFVKHLGYIEHGSDLLKSAYSASDLFVLPSLLETPGLSALEAAASGAKVVVTNVGSTEEYFSSMVSYVNPYNIDEIRKAIEAELAEKRGDSLKAHILKNFTWDKTAAEVKTTYEKVTG